MDFPFLVNDLTKLIWNIFQTIRSETIQLNKSHFHIISYQ